MENLSKSSGKRADMITKYKSSEGLVCNTYYIDDEKKIAVDAGVLIDSKVDIIILTHCHFDHVLNANSMKKRDRCLIYAGRNCAEHLSKPDEATFCRYLADKPEPVIVDRIIKEGDLIKTGKYSFEVMETPGHTDCSICLYDRKNKILFSGDTLFDRNIHGRTDLPTGNEKDMKKSLERLGKLKVKELYDGH